MVAGVWEGGVQPNNQRRQNLEGGTAHLHESKRKAEGGRGEHVGHKILRTKHLEKEGSERAYLFRVRDMSRPPLLPFLYALLPPLLAQPCSTFGESSGSLVGFCQHLAVKGPGSENRNWIDLFPHFMLRDQRFNKPPSPPQPPHLVSTDRMEAKPKG